MPAPPPPPPPTFVAPSASQDGRGMLLQSIRAGKTLKKTVTNDKSAPLIVGKTKDENPAAAQPFRGGGPPNLGGLFSGGMPKLKATGLRSSGTKAEAPVAIKSRGPPPVPPPATQKPQVLGGGEESSSKGFGKPTLAPKPPGGGQKPSPPPKKLNLVGGPSVSRAQSMRLPRSPPVLAPTPSSLHQSQDCLNETQQQQQHHHHHHQQQQPRPIINRALRPPVARPPSPPKMPLGASTTRVAPPPPSRLPVTAPSMPPPPPPPPYRSTSMHQRLAPPPPPTPPARIASVVRNGQTTCVPDLEARFAEKFHSIINFPNPAPFRGFPKVYNSKNAAKQQAPAPPLQQTSDPGTMLRLNASSGAKQWQHNAASSAC